MVPIALDDATIFLPKPFYLVIEDVGWWQGYNGAARGEPYRNNLPRSHCLADYEALTRLAEKLSMRIAIAMVMGEWDRFNVLKDVPCATWMGASWDNSSNQGPLLDQASQYLRENEKYLEIAVHGLCHEYWDENGMQRSEFHDSNNFMRDPSLLRCHLDAYGELLVQNNLPSFPRLFVPPALHHSFGNKEKSIQAILHGYGIEHVTTRIDHARSYSPPHHPALTWECGVSIVERGISPVGWEQVAAAPVWNDPGPVMALHWGNLLHVEPCRNAEIVDGWAALILEKMKDSVRIMAADIPGCWRQAAVYYLGELKREGNSIVIDIGKIPSLPSFSGSFFLRVHSLADREYMCSGADIMSWKKEEKACCTLELLPHKGAKKIVVFLQ